MKITLFTILFTFVCFNITKARPVSYPGGLTLMLMNSGMKNSLHTHYSPTAKTSLGYKIEYWRNDEFTLNMIQMNNLIKRWNKPESQANFYLKSAIGAALSDKADFESKKILLVLLEYRQIGKIKGILSNMQIVTPKLLK